MAVVGSGVAGLGAAWLLGTRHDVVLYERDRRLGGHSNTVDVPTAGGPVAVDTGFIVYNEPNYPNLTTLFAHLGVATDWSDMSFAVSLDGGRYEYGSGWLGFLGQPANVANADHWRLLRDIARFNRTAPELLAAAEDLSLSLGHYLRVNGFDGHFAQRYLMPMAGCIWSAPMRQMMAYPAQTFVRFFSNHGLLRVSGQLRWRTVRGGSRRYVARLADSLQARVRLGHGIARIVRRAGRIAVRDTSGHWDSFDRVVIASHADHALAMIDRPSDDERRLLGAFRYAANTAMLHGDAALMPRRRTVWSSWNYVAREGDWDAPASLTYWMNRLQNIAAQPLFVSLNPTTAPRPDLVWGRYTYDHPLFDRAALEAQRHLSAIQNVDGLLFCGSYCGFGFHEDALASGLEAAERLGVPRPWLAPQGRTRTSRPMAAAQALVGGALPLPAVREPA
ncbi:MAG: FAD-dependent oxidoreductase [Alphaproteobacteria bacterium]|nr:FAD-dependent oxidoreductase [Alphaproteobacteria bacterium]